MIETTDHFQRRLRVLQSVSCALARPLDELGVLRAMHAELGRVLDATICFFGRYDASSRSVHVIWQIHAGQELPGGHFPLGSGPTSQAIRHCQPQLIRTWSSTGPRVQVQYATDEPTLPESSVVVPVLYDAQVIGVLAVQSYVPNAYEDDDVALVQSVAQQMAVALQAAHARTDPLVRASDVEAILASLDDALLVLDAEGRVVRVNQAARQLLCLGDGGLTFGHPLDQAQADRWPLGSPALSEQLRPVLECVRSGATPDDVQVHLDGAVSSMLRCRTSILMKDDAPAGAVMVLSAVA